MRRIFLASCLLLAATGCQRTDPFYMALMKIRSEYGLSQLSVDPAMQDYAQQHADRMAAAGDIWHSDIAATQNISGEIVGLGGYPGAVWESFLASPPHKKVILTSRWRSVGVGVSYGEEFVYVSIVFG